jgi:hypothetical protein
LPIPTAVSFDESSTARYSSVQELSGAVHAQKAFDMSQIARALIAMPPLLGGICLALFLGTQVIFPIIVFYWLTVVGTFSMLFLVRHFPVWCGLSVLASVASLAPVTRSALSWTAWSTGGFAP